MENNQSVAGLTSTELGKLWAAYTGNSMGKCVLRFFLKQVDDLDIKKVLENAITLSETIIDNITMIFKQENIPIPIGFTDEDINLDAPRLFLDRFLFALFKVYR